MVVEIRRQLCDGHVLKLLIGAGFAWLEAHQEAVNRLNVFPVPDGDTGTNMRLTMAKAVDALHDLDESHVGIVSAAMARGALRGARGNSGVILSQLLDGFAKALRAHEAFDAERFAYAAEQAVEAAYRAVTLPVEGTILTVAREAAEGGAAYVRGGGRDLTEMLDAMIEAGRASLARTPTLLPILQQAGVVDSGGQGLLYILEGMARLVHGESVLNEAALVGAVAGETWREALAPDDEAGYGYDVQFLMRGAGLNVAQIRADIEAMGWSALVVGDEALIKVHVHVHDPGQPLSYAIRSGAAINDIVVENMQAQYEQYVAARAAEPPAATINPQVSGVGVVAVVSGDGMARLFMDELGAAAVITGGQTMNPSAEDFVQVIEQLANDTIVLLPNNDNVVMAAQQAAQIAAETTRRRVRVLPSRSMPAGIAAMVAYTGLRDGDQFDALLAEMEAAMDEVVSAEVTYATRDVQFGGITVTAGGPIGLLEGALVVAGDDLQRVVGDLIEKAGGGERELVTLYYGAGVRPQEAEALAAALRAQFVAQDIQLVHGGQPLYPYLISLE